MVTISDLIHSEKEENEKRQFLGLKAFQIWIRGLIFNKKSPSREITFGRRKYIVYEFAGAQMSVNFIYCKLIP